MRGGDEDTGHAVCDVLRGGDEDLGHALSRYRVLSVQ